MFCNFSFLFCSGRCQTRSRWAAGQWNKDNIWPVQQSSTYRPRSMLQSQTTRYPASEFALSRWRERFRFLQHHPLQLFCTLCIVFNYEVWLIVLGLLFFQVIHLLMQRHLFWAILPPQGTNQFSHKVYQNYTKPSLLKWPYTSLPILKICIYVAARIALLIHHIYWSTFALECELILLLPCLVLTLRDISRI